MDPHHCTGLVLSRLQPRESCTPLRVLSPEYGLLLLMQRRGERTGNPTVDLFDSISTQLSTAKPLQENQGHCSGPLFIKEVEILQRRSALASSYQALETACRIGRILEQTPLPDDARLAIHRLATLTIDALARHPAKTETVLCKFLYTLAKTEGLPIREHWLAGLHPSLQQEALEILGTPLDKATGGEEPARRLRERLGVWLREHTEFSGLD